VWSGLNWLRIEIVSGHLYTRYPTLGNFLKRWANVRFLKKTALLANSYVILSLKPDSNYVPRASKISKSSFCVYGFHMIMSFLCGTNWILKYCLDQFRLQRVNENKNISTQTVAETNKCSLQNDNMGACETKYRLYVISVSAVKMMTRHFSSGYQRIQTPTAVQHYLSPSVANRTNCHNTTRGKIYATWTWVTLL
jgi:hypothetical protein